MRTLVVLIAISLGLACTRPNPNKCCVTQAQCDELGVDELRPCETGQACNIDNTCVASECSTSADCTSPDVPVCINNLCVAACQLDEHCAGLPGRPYCDDDGVCVGCIESAQCPAEAAFCDLEDRSCRGCESDSECTSGVCVEADGLCVEEAEVVHVTMLGVDTGECTKATPCRSLSYALQQVTATRKVIHIAGGALNENTATVQITKPVVIDGSITTIQGPLDAPLFEISFAGEVTIEGVSVTPTMGPRITVGTGSTLRVRHSTVQGRIDVMNGAIDTKDTTFSGQGQSSKLEAINCMNGTVTVSATDFRDALVRSANCQLTVSQSTFVENSDGSINATGGMVMIENNLIIQSYELADTMDISTVAPGSMVRFNTFVNTSSIASDGVALNCDETLDVTSNIFAYGSMHPMGPSGGSPCPTRYSLFDSVAVPQHSAGEGNKVSDASMFFVNRALRDFHLAGGSPARESGEPGLFPDDDLDGVTRPLPSGSAPDIGCFEAP